MSPPIAGKVQSRRKYHVCAAGTLTLLVGSRGPRGRRAVRSVSSRGAAKGAARGHARRRAHARSVLDHPDHRFHPWDDGLRHAVLQRSRAEPQAADGRHLDRVAGSQAYTFKLRDGLKFHDGTPVTSKDVVASMNRWGKRDGAGKQLMGYTKSLVAKDGKTFEWTLTEPYGLLIDTLGKTGTSIPFVMREKEAMIDPFQQIQEVVGSGPFQFSREEWVPGSKTVYLKFKDYLPRKEPASGHAGGKVVKVDRVEFLWMSDPQTAQSALVAGEIDYLENPQIDFLPMLRATPGIKVDEHPAMGTMGIIQMNHLHPPFNNVKARQALLYLLSNADYVNTISPDKSLQTLCFSYFGCGVAMETDAGSEPHKGPKDIAKRSSCSRGRLQRRADHDPAGHRPSIHHARQGMC
ncbi:MAG: hypothetical protein IPI73_25645 [Betaproteobacteria bacterium]|nr:hypothetical protein [Betaproteobacteria bacterium]